MKPSNRKQGEDEALQILKTKGIEFNEDHFDKGQAGHSLPDLQYADGRYLEVTHTLHDNKLSDPLSRKFSHFPTNKQNEIINGVTEALTRIRNRDYPTESGIMGALTEEGLEQFSRDKELVDQHFGKYDELTGKRSEFKCNMPIVEHSSDNILREIKEKSDKYSGIDIDLFIFVTQEEFESMMHLIETQKYNASYSSFMQTIYNSPFKTVYVCIWMFEEQLHVVNNPTIMEYWKADNKLYYQKN